MKCPKEGCSGRLKVTHSYTANDRARTQRMVCPECVQVFTSVTFLKDNGGYGEGAKAVAKTLSK